MPEVDLVELLKPSQTLVEAFDKLKEKEIYVIRDMREGYSIVGVRQEFVILQEHRNREKKQVLHPYGSPIGYWIVDKPKKEDEAQRT